MNAEQVYIATREALLKELKECEDKQSAYQEELDAYIAEIRPVEFRAYDSYASYCNLQNMDEAEEALANQISDLGRRLDAEGTVRTDNLEYQTLQSKLTDTTQANLLERAKLKEKDAVDAKTEKEYKKKTAQLYSELEPLKNAARGNKQKLEALDRERAEAIKYEAEAIKYETEAPLRAQQQEAAALAAKVRAQEVAVEDANVAAKNARADEAYNAKLGALHVKRKAAGEIGYARLETAVSALSRAELEKLACRDLALLAMLAKAEEVRPYFAEATKYEEKDEERTRLMALAGAAPYGDGSLHSWDDNYKRPKAKKTRTG